MTSKEYMQCVTAVEPQWLAERGPMFFTLKEAGASRAESRKRQKADKAAMEVEMARVEAARAAEAAAAEEKRRALASAQRSAIATPGRPRDGGGTPLRTPQRGRFIGL